MFYALGRSLLVHDHDGIDGPGVPFQSEGTVKEFFLSSKRCCNGKVLMQPMRPKSQIQRLVVADLAA